jgi:hypothetical protein
MKSKRLIFVAVLTAITWLALGAPAIQAAEEPMNIPVYDEASYTEFVESKMKELDALYLQFCANCGVDPDEASRARMEFLNSVRELMEYMNGRFDSLDPKKGAALSGTETLVSIHALTMLVDILTATELERMTKHPFVN